MKILITLIFLFSSIAFANESCDVIKADKVENIQVRSAHLIVSTNLVILITCEFPDLSFENTPKVNLKQGQCTLQQNNGLNVLFVCSK